MKMGLHTRPKCLCDNRLRDPIGYCWHSKPPEATLRFRYLYRQHRGRHVTAGGQPIPELVQIVRQVLIKVAQGLPIYPPDPRLAFTRW